MFFGKCVIDVAHKQATAGVLLYFEVLLRNSSLSCTKALAEEDNLYCGERSWSVGWFYGISTPVGYLMPNIFYNCILNIYDF